MFYNLIRKIKSENGAMDRVLVTLLFVVVSIAALVLIEEWASSNKEKMMNTATNSISNITKN